MASSSYSHSSNSPRQGHISPQSQTLYRKSSLQFPNTPPEALSYLNSANSVQSQQQHSSQPLPRPTNGHRRVSSGQQQTMSGLSMLQNGTTNGVNGSSSPAQQFEGGRSPPNSKNLSHVPCKFFRQGACQAGKACPFLHSFDNTNEQAPCKYFQKGNCKFGMKCALAHILPDGRRINRPNYSNGGLQLGPRIVPEYNNRASALHNSLLQANMLATHGHPYQSQDGYSPLPIPEQQLNYDPYFGGIQGQDAMYGSPRDEGSKPLSPVGNSFRTLGPLDAVLPASLDSNGISYYARHGPIAASVPSKFGMESPPPSLPRDARALALRSLHQSAFGDEQDLNETTRTSRSPPALGDEASFGQRIMHSQFAKRNRVMSSSFPRAAGIMTGTWTPGEKDETLSNNEEAGTFTFEEDFVPSSLQELLTPQERNRRMSRTEHEEAPIGSWGQRNSLTAPTTPGDSSLSGSPGSSRFGPLFSRHKRDDDSSFSSVGPVGSPLRHSYAQNSSPPFGPIGRPEVNEVSSPTRKTSASNLSQHFHRIRLNRNDSSFNNDGSSGLLGYKSALNGTPPPPLPSTTTTATTTTMPMTRGTLDRNLSSASNRPFSSIDEDTQFFMENDDQDIISKKMSMQKLSGLGLSTSEGVIDPLSGQRVVY